MKLESMDPASNVGWRSGQSKVVGKWSFQDFQWARPVNGTWCQCSGREVWHYGTLMGHFVRVGFTGSDWFFEPVSTGWGSVSDQQGMNKMLKGYGWYYRRAGGAEYVETSTNNTEKVGY